MSHFYHVLNNEDYNLPRLTDSLSTFSATWAVPILNDWLSRGRTHKETIGMIVINPKMRASAPITIPLMARTIDPRCRDRVSLLTLSAIAPIPNDAITGASGNKISPSNGFDTTETREATAAATSSASQNVTRIWAIKSVVRARTARIART